MLPKFMLSLISNLFHRGFWWETGIFTPQNLNRSLNINDAFPWKGLRRYQEESGQNETHDGDQEYAKVNGKLILLFNVAIVRSI